MAKLFRVRVPDCRTDEDPDTCITNYRKQLSEKFQGAGGKKSSASISSMSVDEHCDSDVLCVRVNGKMTQGQQSMLNNLSPN